VGKEGGRREAGSVCSVKTMKHSPQICSMHTGQALPRGEKGEIYVRSTSIMNGYLKDPEATRKVIDEGGWFHTGILWSNLSV
jgi:long-subunit acyl-CoA synthetase (AMP-forming)